MKNTNIEARISKQIKIQKSKFQNETFRISVFGFRIYAKL